MNSTHDNDKPEIVRPIHIPNARFMLLLILIVSIVLRWILVLRGGQFFFPDESRYQTSRAIAQGLWNGHLLEALKTLTVPHLGFKIVGVIPGLIEVFLGENDDIPALFFSLFSVATMMIVWFLALRAGADEKEALFAVYILGTSNSLFYFSSHLLPYDLAMVFGMLALYAGVSGKFSKSGSFLTGLLGSFAFVTYNGYWSLTVFAVFVHVLYALKFRHRALVRIIFMLLGFLVPFVAIYFFGMFLSGENWLKEYLTFAGTVVQGDYSEGAVLPFLYLWATEKYLLILLLFLAAIAFIVLPKRPRRVILWLGGLLFIYGCLSIPSVMMNKFVVYGRLVRQMVPFIALLGAFGLKIIDSDKRLGRLTSSVMIVISLVFAGFNFRSPLLLTYPLDFLKKIQTNYRDLQMSEDSMSFDAPDVIDAAPYRVYYLKYIYPVPTVETPVSGDILMMAEHPQKEFPPFLYEGYAPDQRKIFQSLNFAMLVMRVNDK